MLQSYLFLIVLVFSAQSYGAELISCKDAYRGEMTLTHVEPESKKVRYLITVDTTLNSSYIGSWDLRHQQILEKVKSKTNEVLVTSTAGYDVIVTMPLNSLMLGEGETFAASLEITLHGNFQDFVSNKLTCTVVQ